MSQNWIPPFQLEAIELRSWRLGPHFPSWLKSQKDFVDLDLSSTGISGHVPDWFWALSSRFEYLNLSHNQLQASIPNILRLDSFNSMIYLSSNQFIIVLPLMSPIVTKLDLSNNSFSGGISYFLCDGNDEAKKLEILHQGKNNLSGEIPDCWMNWQSLKVINLEDNKLRGIIPSSMGFLGRLKSLHLRNSSLFGEVPLSLQNCTQLVVIDLSENEFSGRIPEWIGKKLSNFMALGFLRNKFSGEIPLEICLLTFLQILDLADNNLSGDIPRCIDNFSAMVMKNQDLNSIDSDYLYSYISYSFHARNFLENAFVVAKGRELQYDTILHLVTSIDLSNNNITGKIPEEFTSLLELHFLNRFGNHLTGMIPRRIGDMKSLQSLDFSRNQLFGQIPPGMSGLNFLSYLHLSDNKLTGKIPSGTQLQSFSATCYMGNHLCGPPLAENCSDNRVNPDTSNEGDDDLDDNQEIDWLYTSIAFGFVVGFLGFCGPLFFHREWRQTYFRALEEVLLKLCVVL